MIKDGIEFYYTATKLKDLLRQGAVQWDVKKERLESVAEHIYGCMILAITMQGELNLQLDMKKVLEMLTIHELEEIVIGDITPLDDKDKKSLQNRAIEEIEKMLTAVEIKDRVLGLTKEYNENKTDESKFAKAIDKLECVLEFKKYQDNNQVSLNHLTADMLKNKKLKELVDEGKYDLADIFFIFHKKSFEYLGINDELWYSVIKKIVQ